MRPSCRVVGSGYHATQRRVNDVRGTNPSPQTAARGPQAARLRAHVNQLCRDFRGTSYVLLVGAIEAGQGQNWLPDAERRVVPALAGTTARPATREPAEAGKWNHWNSK